MLILTAGFGTLVLLGCSFADRIGRRLGLIDHPDNLRKRHERPTPLVGGIALMPPLAAIAVAMAVRHPEASLSFLVLAGGCLGFMLLGLIDDRRQASPRSRLLVSTLLCLVLLIADPVLVLPQLDLGLVTIPLGLFAIPFTVLCLVGLQNAVNMADGLNGLVIGLAIGWLASLLLHAPPHLVPFLSLTLLGLFIVLPYNLAGRLFLGDAGSYALAVVIGLLMIYVQNQSASLTMPMVVLLLLVPVVDCLRVMATRLLAGRSPLQGDRNHLHHRLSRQWRWPASVLVYLSIAVLPGLLAALWPQATGTMLVLAPVAYAGVLWRTRRHEVAADLTAY